MKLRVFLILFIAFYAATLAAQHHHCGADALEEEKRKIFPARYAEHEKIQDQVQQILKGPKPAKISATEPVYTIPVVVHVVHNVPSGAIAGNNIPDAQILAQIQVLNEDFRRKSGTNGFNNDPVGADVNIEFCLATMDPSGNFTTGITRTYNSKNFFNVSFSDENLLKSLAYWPSDQYLNLWVCRLEPGYLGYAQYPNGNGVPGLPPDGGAETDGVVIDYRSFGKGGTAQSPYNLGRTPTHEAGHWLGLDHIWGDTYCGNDWVADTPPDEDPNDDLDCYDSSDCDNNGSYNQDMINNYMDYSADACMNIFTIGQKTRMRTVMETSPRRMALLNSGGCCIATGTVSVPLEEGFEDTTFLSAGWIIQNPDSNITWENNITTGYNSTASIFIENDSANLGEMDYLTTPFIRFSDIRPFMEFDLAYAQDPLAGSDTLVISYSPNCKIWTPLLTLSGNQLITTGTVTSYLTPGQADWKRIKVSLAALQNKPIGRIRFENRSGNRNNIYIDNINIYKVSENLSVKPYPNPASAGSGLNVEILFEGEENITLQMYDMLGQKILETTEMNQISQIRNINVDGLSRGIYILKVSVKGQSVTKKVLVNY
ncbi:MAG: T9SS type A sorting domain-containing protein [Cytophagaceae bacterium]|nr:T9SS type A sorting domain-containing protein [Cytophagaceae bacterium]